MSNLIVDELPVSQESVFISYRQCDSEDIAGRIHDRLVVELGSDCVFRDHEGIDPGADFSEIILKKLAESKCVLIIIGPNWLIELKKRAKGKDKDKDFVKIEVRKALDYGMKIIPVRVLNAQQLLAKDLKHIDGFEKLSEKNWIEVRSGEHFNEDMQKLVSGIRGNYAVQAPKEGEIVGGWLLNKLLSKKSSWGYSYLAEKDGNTKILKLLHQDFKCEKTINRYIHLLINLLKLPKLDHVVQLYYPNFSAEFKTWFHTMDFIEGELLPKYFKSIGLPFNHEMIYKLFIPLARDLAVAHKSDIFHRNIKPGNFVLSPDKSKLVLTDYGLSINNRAAGKSPFLADLNFAPPEQLRGIEPNAASDVFSLAATIYYSLDFNNPKISSFSEFEPDLVPGKLGQVLYEALRNNNKKRIKNAADFADRLQWAKDS